MNTSITARHCEISDELRARASAVLARLGTLITRPTEGTVVFDVAPGLATAEIRMVGSGETVRATGEERDHRTALDRAEDKIRRQLDKATQARRGRGAKGAA
ncbi:MAG TPA: HPF/RaiA family ribosome-associated protein [Gemmatimonadales bacterium]|jgi:ribosomal subunit interface protein